YFRQHSTVDNPPKLSFLENLNRMLVTVFNQSQRDKISSTKRALEIQKEIAELKKDTTLDPTERAKLIAELQAEAKENRSCANCVTSTDMQALADITSVELTFGGTGAESLPGFFAQLNKIKEHGTAAEFRDAKDSLAAVGYMLAMYKKAVNEVAKRHSETKR